MARRRARAQGPRPELTRSQFDGAALLSCRVPSTERPRNDGRIPVSSKSDEAYVLTTLDLGEADRIVTLLAEHSGRVRGVAASAGSDEPGDVMSETVTHLSRRCPRCGRELPPDAPEGLCASCLLTAGAETLTGSSDVASTGVASTGDPSRPGAPRLVDGQIWGPYHTRASRAQDPPGRKLRRPRHLHGLQTSRSWAQLLRA